MQFETIHLFLYGNGRIGRLLITALLEHWNLLPQPSMYLSGYLKQHQAEYYRRRSSVRTEGDWAGWVAFFSGRRQGKSGAAVMSALHSLTLTSFPPEDDTLHVPVPVQRTGLQAPHNLRENSGMKNKMKRIFLRQALAVMASAAAVLAAPAAYAEDEAPDVMIKRLLSDVLETIKTDKAIRAGDVARVVALVDSRIMPHVNFQRMTASVVGPAWRQATPEQQKRLQEEFKILLVRAYAGALAQLKDQTVSMKPFKAAAEDKEVLVRAEVKGGGETIQLDYRLENVQGQSAGWRIYNLNVMGVWLVETYRSQFAPEISAKGVDGLIGALSERNKANGKKA